MVTLGCFREVGPVVPGYSWLLYGGRACGPWLLLVVVWREGLWSMVTLGCMEGVWQAKPIKTPNPKPPHQL